jgi:hypothetical protein
LDGFQHDDGRHIGKFETDANNGNAVGVAEDIAILSQTDCPS